MKKIVVTGEHGALSVELATELRNRTDQPVENLGVRGNLWREFDFSEVGIIVHVAGLIPGKNTRPEDFYRVNRDLTRELATKAKAEGVEQFLYLSSMSVYGIELSIEKGKGVVYANTPCAPKEDYGKSKFEAEEALRSLEDETFRVAIIRVPSLYNVGRTAYLDRIKRFFDRYPRIPRAFEDRFKSILYTGNLYALIGLLIERNSRGIFCPDDGKISAVDLYSAMVPEKKTSRIFGLAARIFKWRPRVKEYFGNCCYAEELTDLFGGAYRETDFRAAIRKIYGE